MVFAVAVRQLPKTIVPTQGVAWDGMVERKLLQHSIQLPLTAITTASICCRMLVCASRVDIFSLRGSMLDVPNHLGAMQPFRCLA